MSYVSFVLFGVVTIRDRFREENFVTTPARVILFRLQIFLHFNMYVAFSRANQQMYRIFHVVFPQVGKLGHRDAIENTMVGRPADRHYVHRHHVPFFIEPRHFLRSPERADYHLRWQNYRLRVRPAHLNQQHDLYIYCNSS